MRDNISLSLPVGRSTQSNAIWTVRQRPDFSNDNPCTWTPGVTEVDDEEPDHDYSSPTGGLMVLPVMLVLGSNDSLAQVISDLFMNPLESALLTIMIWQVAIPIAPMISVGFLPHLSTYITAGIVAMNMTIPTTPVANKLTAVEFKPSFPKMVGA